MNESLNPMDGSDHYVFNEFWEYSKKENKKRGDIFYHYTSLDAFQNIIEKKQIRFSDCQYLNDSSELEYGKELLSEIIEKQKEELIKTSSERDLDNKIIKLLDLLYSAVFLSNKVKSANSPSIYIFCLCEDGDLLSQWKGYKKEGCAVAIQFEIKKLTSSNRAFFRKVIYEREYQEEILNRIIHDFIIDCKSKVQKNEGVSFSQCMFDLIFAITFFKHPKFSEEKEWRFVFHNIIHDGKKQPVKFFNKNLYLLPYIEFTFTEVFSGITPFIGVIIGPNMNPLSKASIYEFLNSQYPDELGNGKLKIYSSQIPFRTF